MSKTTIRECTCENEWQDEIYGEKKRVFNAGMKGMKCTSCSKVVAGTIVEEKKTKKK